MSIDNRTAPPAAPATATQRLPVPAVLRPPAGERLTPEQYVEIKALALSAQCAAYAAKMESLQEHRPTVELKEEKFQREFKEADRRVGEILQAVRDLCREHRQLDPQNCSRALAVALNASGRAAHLRGVVSMRDGVAGTEAAAQPFQDAIAAFEESIHLQPHMPDPYIGVAAAIMQLKSRAGLDWQEQAERVLDRALALNPKNGKANYYRGKLLLREARDAAGTPGAPELMQRAVQHLKDADKHPWQSYLLAQALGRYQDTPDIPSAIRLMDRSILALDRPDVRYVFFCELVLESRAPTERLLDRALAVAKKLRDDGIDEALKQRGGELVAAVEKRIAEFDAGQGADSPPEQPPVDQAPPEQPPAEQPPADEPPAEQPPVEQPPADEPPADPMGDNDVPPADPPPGDEQRSPIGTGDPTLP